MLRLIEAPRSPAQIGGTGNALANYFQYRDESRLSHFSDV